LRGFLIACPGGGPRQFTSAARNCVHAKASKLGDSADAPSADSVGLDGGVQPPLLVVEGGKECRQPLAVALLWLVGRGVLMSVALMPPMT
jgi:hypothetical protein